MSKDEERDFRLRPRKPPIPRQKNERIAWAAAYRTIMHYARSSRALKRAGRSRGGRPAAIPNCQRCAIRVTYARNAVKGHWRAHGRYITRESAAGESTAVGFDQKQHGIDVLSTLERWQAAREARLWKIIISPEFGERLDLTRLTRDVMGRIEKDLHTQLEWVAVSHFNTEHPHVHVALRGVAQNGAEIRLPRDYVKAGIRSIAEDYCTRQIGHRTEMDAAEAEGRVVVHGEDEQSGRCYLMLEGVDARVHYVEFTPEMEEARARGEFRTNAFVRLRRVLVDEEARLEVEDLGNSEAPLKNRNHFKTKAHELLRQGVAPVEQGWGGWLGQYHRALTQAAMETEYPTPQRHKGRERTLGR